MKRVPTYPPFAMGLCLLIGVVALGIIVVFFDNLKSLF